MLRPVATLQRDGAAVVVQPTSGWVHKCAIVLAATAVVSSAFHFWPFEGSAAWRIVCVPNLVALAWVLLMAGYALPRHNWPTVSSLLPPLSVFAYVIVNVLSIAFAHDVGRAANFTAKLGLMLVGGYLLFTSAISSTKSLHTLYRMVTVAVIISVSYCLILRFVFNSDNFGFHGSAYKYGTYVGTLAPLSGAYLLMGSKWWNKLLGAVVVTGALISCGTVGCVAAIVAGMVALAIATPGWSVRICAICCLVCGIGPVILFDSSPAFAVLHNDIKLAEKDGANLKQRYIEWQAEVNLLEERSIAGTATGCINEYRSNFYYRLPKLNTLKAFDQNGWLATGAETGILGLVCFCWIFVYYFKPAYSQVTTRGVTGFGVAHRFAIANLVGLLAASVANLFCSVHYNGILIVLVLVLAFILRTNQLFGES